MFVNPNNVLEKLGLSEDMTAADLGSGAGNWALPLSRILDKGFVFAVDVQEEPLSALSAAMKVNNVTNIRPILGDVEENIPEIANSSCDLVILANILFQAENKRAVLEQAKRILKSKAQVLVVDWKINSSLGPKQGRISKQEVEKIAKDLGFLTKQDLEQETGAYHYGLVFTKP